MDRRRAIMRRPDTEPRMSRSICLWPAIVAIVSCHHPPPSRPAPMAPTDSLVSERRRYIDQVLQQIKGRESLPAPQVFKNIKSLPATLPAERLLGVMEVGYARSLGVSCTYCHIPGEWEKDDKLPKQITREMTRMVFELNQRLKAIPNIRSERPVVNCTTCHRGQIKPALD